MLLLVSNTLPSATESRGALDSYDASRRTMLQVALKARMRPNAVFRSWRMLMGTADRKYPLRVTGTSTATVSWLIRWEHR